MSIHFRFVLLSACADFTVCTVATHPRSLAWHRRLRKRRQLARRRLRQRCATQADCWRIATHHGSCLPGPITWSRPVCGRVNHDNRRKCTTRDCRHPGGPPSAWDNRRGTRHASRTRTSASSAKSTMDVSRLFLPELCLARLLPQLQSRRQLGWTWYWWWWQSCKEAASASERLRGGDSLSSEAMAVEDSGPAKAEEQDRLKALDASIAKSREGARRQARCGYRRGSSAEEAGETGDQGSDAVPQVYQGSPQSGDRGKGKGCYHARGFCSRKRWI